jgi:methionyl-tRNA formyltransferase
MLLRHLPALLEGTAPRRPQDPAEGDVLPRRTPDMGITGWDRTPTQVHDWVRALTHPYPGAWTTLDGVRLMLWEADQPSFEISGSPPGTLLGPDGLGVRVAVHGGTVRLLRVQEEGNPEERAAAWFLRRGLQPGVTFDHVPAQLVEWALGRRAEKPTDASPVVVVR